MSNFVLPAIALGLLTIGGSSSLPAMATQTSDEDSFVAMDLNLDGHLDLSEVMIAAGLTADGELSEEMRIDIDQSIQVSLSEAEQEMAEHGYSDPAMTEAQIARVMLNAISSANEAVRSAFTSIDADSNGHISMDEFITANRQAG